MKIILASASPRRREILHRYHLDFQVIKADIDESMLEQESPIDLVKRLSFEKGMFVAKKNNNDLVISADTIVVLNDKILGKPLNRLEAFEMISSLSNKKHKVITGFSLINLSNNKIINDFVVTEVKFKKLTDKNINDYLDTGEYVDKAGAYGIQGYGALLVESIEGDFFNIVGFPISKVSDLLRSEFHIDLLKQEHFL
ncbi:MAG: Maf family protein [Clostridioides sp.]|jgi:septum formation protein|nr:Maf family protein [Clostridioides sp.]